MNDETPTVYRGVGDPSLPNPITDETAEWFDTSLLGNANMNSFNKLKSSQDTLDRIKSVIVHSIDAEGEDPDGRTSRSYGGEPEEALEEIYQLLFAEDERSAEVDNQVEQPTLW